MSNSNIDRHAGDAPLLAVPRFAVIGCGAIAESYFLPLLTTRRDLCSTLCIVDSNSERLAATSKQFGITNVATCLEQVLDHIDAAAIATPHNTHFSLSQTLMTAGKHVFCEKPMTTTVQEATDMVAMADHAGVVLMTNNWRRCCPAFQEIKHIIETGALGKPISATWVEGKKFNWPTVSGFYFTQQSLNGLPPPGIMLDIGAHVVDLLCWWLGDSPTVIDCQTDSFGGPEARATIILDFDGVRVQTDLSYYQKLVNTYRINFQDGTITGNAGDPHRFVLHHKGKERVISLPRIDPAAHMIANFVDAIAGRDRPVTAGRDVVPSIKAISHAYQMARSFEAPWLPRF